MTIVSVTLICSSTIQFGDVSVVDLTARLKKGATYDEIKNAIKFAYKAIGVDGKNPKAYYRRGLAKQQEGDVEGCVADLELALSHCDASVDEVQRQAIDKTLSSIKAAAAARQRAADRSLGMNMAKAFGSQSAASSK